MSGQDLSVQEERTLTIKWAQMASPRGEVREGFWVLDHKGEPVHENACFATHQEAEDWFKSFNWF